MAVPILLDANSRQLAQSSRTPILVTNLSATATAYLDDDPSVSASSFDFQLTPGATITWQADKPLYACTDPNQSCSINLAYKTTDLFDPSAIAGAIQAKGASQKNLYGPQLYPYTYGVPTLWPAAWLDSAEDGRGNSYRFADYNYLVMSIQLSGAGSSPQTIAIKYATDSQGSDSNSYPTQYFLVKQGGAARVCVPVLAPYVNVGLPAPSGGPFQDPSLTLYGTNFPVEPLLVGYSWLNRVPGFGAGNFQNITLTANTNVETEFEGTQGNILFGVTNNTTGILNFIDLYEYDLTLTPQLVSRQKFGSLGLSAGLAAQCTAFWVSPMFGNQFKVISRCTAAGTISLSMQYQPMSPTAQYYAT